jgi:ribokinase
VPTVCVVGSVNLDLVATVPRLPRPGETLTGASLEHVPGGKGANQAVAAARLGAEVRFVGAVGEDDFGREALAELGGVADLSGLQAVDAPTGIALILVDEAGENQIVVVPGANHALAADRIEVGEPDALVCQLEVADDAIEAAVRQAPDAFFCLNAAPSRPVSAAILEGADLIVANSLELEALGSSPMGALFALTLGADGALLLEGGEEVARAAPPVVEAVDGTAAGDAFTACLVVSLLEGREREEALRRACAAGAIAASRPGAQPSLPTAAEVDEILRAT